MIQTKKSWYDKQNYFLIKNRITRKEEIKKQATQFDLKLFSY